MTPVALISLVFSCVTIFPELYSWLRAPRYWIPLNSQPIAVGDDYHYFTVLSRLSNRLSINENTNFFFEQPARANISQWLPQIFNLIPYRIGSALLDKRLGLLLVRLFDRFAFFFSSALVAEQIGLRFFGQRPPNLILVATGLFLYLLFPGPFSLNTRKSLLRNISNAQFIFEKNRTSDISRAYVLETVLPIFLLSTYLLLRYSDFHNLFLGIAIFSVILNLLAYPPLGIVYLVQTSSISILFGYSVIFILPVFLIGISFLFFLDRYIRGDAYGRETYTVSNLPRAGINLTKWNLSEVSIVVSSVLLCLNFNHRFGFFISLIGAFIVFDLTSHHNFSRIWFRGAAAVFQLYASIVLISCCYSFSSYGMYFLAAICFGSFLYFYVRQSQVLHKIGYFYVLQEYHSIFELIVQKAVGQSKILLVSNDTEILKLASIYSNHHVYGLHHGLTQNNYESQLELMANSYSLLGLEFQQFHSDFTFNFDYFDYLNRRKESFSFPEPYGISSFNKQMFATYSIFSEELSKAGFLVDRKWTSAFDLKLRLIWDSATLDDILGNIGKSGLNIERILRNDDLESKSFSINRYTDFQ